MILHTLPPAFEQRNPSPFCLKTEMALTHLGLDFTVHESLELNKAPKRKMPWLEDDGVIIADSDLILEHLDNKTNGGLFGHLSAQQVGVGTAFVRLAEDHLYWFIVASRWLTDDWFIHVKRDFFGSMPAPLGWLVSRMARKQMRQTYNLHGLGRHSPAEQEQLLRADLDAIAGQVSKRGFIVGNELSAFDFGVAAMLAAGMDNKPDTWVSVIANEYPALRDYIEKVQSAVGVYCRFVN